MIGTEMVGTGASVPGSLSEAMGGTAMAKEEFLSLLLAQLKNQDPLSPMENHEFASQLAQFSQLEELQNIDGSIEQGLEVDLILTSAINNTLAATVIGKSATAYGNTIEHAGSENENLGYRVDGYANEVTVTINDSAGNRVRTIYLNDITEGTHDLTWDGLNDDGYAVSAGSYTFEVEATDIDGKEVSAMTLIRGMIEGVRYDDGYAVLVVNGIEMSFGSILEIGEPGEKNSSDDNVVDDDDVDDENTDDGSGDG